MVQRSINVANNGVVGSDPGVALSSSCFPISNMVLTIPGNSAAPLWPLSREIEKSLKLC
jgi:hypothetical protein